LSQTHTNPQRQREKRISLRTSLALWRFGLVSEQREPDMKEHAIPLSLAALLLAVAGCGDKASLSGKYHIEQDGYGFGPGADKIILDLRSDGTFDVKAGPLVMLDGTWESTEGGVKFSRGEGAMVASYRADGSALVPVQDGKDVPGWRWRRN
jgi:hypothetical protein